MADDDKTAKAPAVCGEMGRREFLGYSGGALGALWFGGLTFPQTALAAAAPTYPIDQTVVTTRERMIAFPATLPGLSKTQIDQVDQYEKFGYGAWTYGAPLAVATRADLLPAGAAPRPAEKKTKLLRFFTFTDVHITDKEAPNQLISFQQSEPSAASVTSIYSPVMLSTTQVLDAAIQTVNALHKSDPFDFGVMLGDARSRRARARTPARTRSTTRSRSRPPGSTAPFPGIRPSAITIISISARSRSTAMRAFAPPILQERCGRSAIRSLPGLRISRSCSTSPRSRPSRHSIPA